MKKLLALALTVSTATALTACGGNDEIEIVIPDSFDEEVTIDFWHQSSDIVINGKTVDAYTPYIESFNEKYPNVTIKTQRLDSYTALSTAVTAAISANNQPNLTVGYSNNFVEYMTSNAVAKLNNYIEDDTYGFSANDISDFKAAGFWDDNICYDSNESVYSLSLSKSSEAMYVDLAILKAAGYTIEQIEENLLTWDGVDTMSSKLKELYDAGQDGISCFEWHHDTSANWAITVLGQTKSPYTTAEGDILFIDDSKNAASKQAINDYILAYSDHAVIRKVSGTYGFGQVAAGTKWMNIGSTSAGNYYDDVEELGVYPIPQIDQENPYAVLQGPSMALLADEDQMQNLATWLFMKHLTSTEISAEIAIDTGYMPVRQSSYELQDFKDFLANGSVQSKALQAAVSQKLGYTGTPAFVGSNETRNAIGTIVDEILGTTPISIDAAFKNAKDTLQFYII